MNYEVIQGTFGGEQEMAHLDKTRNSKEFKWSQGEAKILSEYNDLAIKLRLNNENDQKLVVLLTQERILRNEINEISQKLIEKKAKRISENPILQRFTKYSKTKLENLYKAKEVVVSDKASLIRDHYLTQAERTKAGNIDLSVNDLFKRSVEIHGRMLDATIILDEEIRNIWAACWVPRIHDQNVI